MMRSFLLLTAWATLWLATGCGTLNRMQFAVVPPQPELGKVSTLTDADQAMVLEIVGQTAERLRLTDRTAASMVPGTLVYYQGTDVDDPMRLIAWRQEDQILIDFMHATEGGLGEPLAFREARERLMTDLQAAFGPRLKMVPLGEQRAP